MIKIVAVIEEKSFGLLQWHFSVDHLKALAGPKGK